jgi:hypothetical protein
MTATLIPVKKADGTIEKITMEEFRARQKAKTVPTVPTVAPSKPLLVAAKKEPAPAVAIKKEDAKSLLEEELPKKDAGGQAHAVNRKTEAAEIVKKLNLVLPENTSKRLLGLIELRLKDIRAGDEVRDWLVAPDSQMGIGLGAEKAESILKLCREYMGKAGGSNEKIAPLKKPAFTTATALAKEDREPFPSNATPNNAFVHGPLNAKGDRPALDNLVRQESAKMSADNISDILPKREPISRPMVRDITATKPLNLGPIEEIKYFTLTDFRRLSSDPAEAASRLKQKFTNLKDESYILYLNALEAWRTSPLFNDYMSASIDTLNQKKKLTDISTEKEKIQLKEIGALIVMEKDLL